MDVKLYVGNLAYSTTQDDLRTLFAQAGNVTSVELIKDRDSGQSKGFAFVTMSTQSEAQKAISMFNAFSMGDRELKVSTAKPREERGGGYVSRYGAFGSSGGGGPRGHSRRGGSRRY
ncbi:MAG: RNA-binding protein [Chloroflexi bacterium]|nr:RNA-binding protein [Chloroflexota bacterium]